MTQEFKTRESYMEYWGIAHISNNDLADLRPKIFKGIKAYRNVDLSNDKMVAGATQDIIGLLEDKIYDREEEKNEL